MQTTINFFLLKLILKTLGFWSNTKLVLAKKKKKKKKI